MSFKGPHLSKFSEAFEILLELDNYGNDNYILIVLLLSRFREIRLLYFLGQWSNKNINFDNYFLFRKITLNFYSVRFGKKTYF